MGLNGSHHYNSPAELWLVLQISSYPREAPKHMIPLLPPPIPSQQKLEQKIKNGRVQKTEEYSNWFYSSVMYLQLRAWLAWSQDAIAPGITSEIKEERGSASIRSCGCKSFPRKFQLTSSYVHWPQLVTPAVEDAEKQRLSWALCCP